MAAKIKLPQMQYVVTWDEKKVVRWLKKVNLEDCVPAFEGRHIDGEKLLELTEQKLFTYQDVKIKHRSQIAKCVNECKSQASNAKRIVGTIRQRRPCRKRPTDGTANGDDEYDSEDEDYDDWDSDFDDDFDDDDEIVEETAVDVDANSTSLNYIIENEKNEAKENSIKQLECTAPNFVPKQPEVPQSAVVIAKSDKTDHRCNYPRPPLKRPPSQPPPPPVPQLPSQEVLEEYEIPISHQKNSSFPQKLTLICEPQSQSNLSQRNSLPKINAFPAEKYQFNNNQTDENYEIVESTPLPLPLPEKPALLPRSNSTLKNSPPPALPVKPKKFQDASHTFSPNPETLRSISRPKLPTVDDTVSEGSGSLASVLGSTIMNSILGRRNSTPSSSPKMHRSFKDLSGNFSSADSQSSRSSSPEKDGLFVVGSSAFISSASSSSWSSDSKSPPHIVTKNKSITTDEIAQNMASRPLPPVPDLEPKIFLKKQKNLQSYPWFHEVERHDAENEIKNFGVSGAFLVRPSKRAGKENPYTLTILYEGKVFHLNVRQRPDDTFALGKEKKKEKTFASVADLIAYHQIEKILLTSRGESAGQTTLRAFPEK